MNKCTQCNEPADLHISYLAKKSMNENVPTECDICSHCMSILWGKYQHTQFGQTVCIEPIG